MTKKETAEQKLLKLIEETQAADAAPDSAAAASGPSDAARAMAASVKGGGLSSLAFPPIFGFLAEFFKKSAGVSPSGKIAFGLSEANMLLMGVVVLMAIFLVMNVSSGMKAVGQRLDISVSAGNVAQTQEVVLTAWARPLDAYLESIKQRNIFQPFEKKIEEVIAAVPSGPSQRIQDIVKDLKLVGVSWQDSAETASAMIEDTKSGITYFYKKGEKVREVEIKEIYTDRIVITLDGEEMTLRL